VAGHRRELGKLGRAGATLPKITAVRVVPVTMNLSIVMVLPNHP